MKKFVSWIFLGLFALLSSIVCVGQILGFAGLYYSWLAILLVILLFVLFCYLLRQTAYPFLINQFSDDLVKNNKILNNALYVVGFALLLLLILLPLIGWPYTNINQKLAYDAGVYHLPKAVELLVQHSAWDFTISYGEYPWGFESLIAFSYVLSKAGLLIGTVHALIAAFFVFSLFFMLLRYSKLPGGFLFFVSVVVFCSFDLIRMIESNPWWLLRLLAFSIGKNDLFLAAGLIAFLAFSPFGRTGDNNKFSIIGMSLANGLILSTKPNAIFIEAFVWIITLVIWFKNSRQTLGPILPKLQEWIAPIISFLIGSLWILRNLLGRGELVSQESLSIQQWSIINNLTNPYFYNYLDIHIKVLLAIILLTLVFTIFAKRFNWRVLALFFVMLFSFIITPATAFFGSNQKPAEIDWRFGIYLLVFEVPLLLLMVEPILDWIFAHLHKSLQIILALMLVFGAFWFGYENRGRIELKAKNLIVLHDTNTTSVGVDGYFSAYDYTQKNVHHSVVWVENGYPFYLYDPDLTNTVSRQTPADYYVFIKDSLVKKNAFPEYITQKDWLQRWQLVYDDGNGKVFERKN